MAEAARHPRRHLQPDPSGTLGPRGRVPRAPGPRPRPVHPGGDPASQATRRPRRGAPPLRDGESGRGGSAGFVASRSSSSGPGPRTRWTPSRRWRATGRGRVSSSSWEATRSSISRPGGRRSVSAPSRRSGSVTAPAARSSRRARRRARCSRGSAGRAGAACRRRRRRRWPPATARSSRRARSPSPARGVRRRLGAGESVEGPDPAGRGRVHRRSRPLREPV
jgi:hypothetical protein